MATIKAISWFFGVGLEKAAAESKNLNETTKELILESYEDYLHSTEGR